MIPSIDCEHAHWSLTERWWDSTSRPPLVMYECKTCGLSIAAKWLPPSCATAKQLQALDSLIAYGTQKEAAAALGLNMRTFKNRIAALRRANGMTTVQLAAWRYPKAA